MSRQQNQGEKYVILQTPRFHELCGLLGLKDQCCSDPNKKVIEKAFRKKALKTHPDKGGDQKEFKKINDAYNRLLGHCTKLEITNEEAEMSCNSIIIEVSKISLPKWREKLKNKYGIPKCENVKGTLFEGPYKQYRGRSNNTGPITIVMYEDPQDAIPKLLIRSEKYMAWIAEQMMPLHLHVDKGRSIQFDQWRICHLAEFGFTSFAKTPTNFTSSFSTPSTPAPQPKRTEDPPKTKEEKSEAKELRKKARREAAKKKEDEENGTNTEKEKSEPQKKEPYSDKIFEEAGKDVDDGDEWEEVIEDPNDPFPKLWNMADQSYVKDGRRYRKKAKNVQKPASDVENKVFTCGSCGVGYTNLMDYQHHKTVCIPDEDFGQSKSENKEPIIDKKPDTPNNHSKTEAKEEAPKPKEESAPMPDFNFLTGNSKPKSKPAGSALFECDKCGAGYDKMVAYTKHKAQCQATSDADKPANNDNKSAGETVVNSSETKIRSNNPKDNANNVEKDLCKSPSPNGCETLPMTHSKERKTMEDLHVTPNDDTGGANNSGKKPSEHQKDSLSKECKSGQKLTNDQNTTEEMKQSKLTVMQEAHDGEEITSKETVDDYLTSKETLNDDLTSKETLNDDLTSKETVDDDLTSKETLDDDQTTKETLDDDLTCKETLNDDQTSKETIDVDLTCKEFLNDDLTSKETIDDDLTSKETLNNDLTSKQTRNDDLTSKETLNDDLTSKATIDDDLTTKVTQSLELATKETEDKEVKDKVEVENENMINREVSWGGVVVTEDDLCSDLSLFSTRWPRLDPAVLENNWNMYKEGVRQRRANYKPASTKI